MASSVVIYMNSPEDSAGYATKGVPGMAVRMTISDDILEDGIDFFCEIIGGSDTDRTQIIERLVESYDATYKVTHDREYVWRANVCLHDVQAARQNPLFDAVIAQREWADRFVIVYEAGMLVLRLDFPPELTDAQQEQVTNILCAAARMQDPNAVARHGIATQELDSWRPLSDVVPAK